MTPDELNAIEARAEAARGGPWCANDSRSKRRTSVIWATVGNYHVAWVGDEAETLAGANEQRVADAEFIAHAREDIPALVAEVRYLRNDLLVARQAAALHAEANQDECQAAIVTASLASFNAGIEKCAAWHEARAKELDHAFRTPVSIAVEDAVQAEHDYAAALRALKETP